MESTFDLEAHRRHRRVARAWRAWTATYLVALLAPVALIAIGPGKGGDRLDLFALYAGYVAFTSYVLQLVLPSRMPFVASTFGVPLLLRVHRFVGSLVLGFVVLHVALFALHRATYRAWLIWPFDDGARAWTGWIAALTLVVLLATTWWRRRLRLRFEAWRGLHVVLGLAGTGAALAHVLLVSWYSSWSPVRWLLVGLFLLGLLSVAYLRLLRPYARLAAPYVVRSVVPERGGARTLQLEAAGHGGIRFAPGQFAWIKVHGGAYSLREHPFSLASSAVDPSRPSFTIKALGDFTRDVEAIQPGTRVLVDGPHGAWTPALPSAGYVLIVAGIGVTPAMSIVRTLADTADPRPVRLVYGARTWDDVTFREELEQLASRPNLALELVFVLDQPPAGWQGHVGRVDAAALPALLPPDAGARNVLVCGPPAMIDGVLDGLNRLGIPDALVYADRF